MVLFINIMIAFYMDIIHNSKRFTRKHLLGDNVLFGLLQDYISFSSLLKELLFSEIIFLFIFYFYIILYINISIITDTKIGNNPTA